MLLAGAARVFCRAIKEDHLDTEDDTIDSVDLLLSSIVGMVWKLILWPKQPLFAHATTSFLATKANLSSLQHRSAKSRTYFAKAHNRFSRIQRAGHINPSTSKNDQLQ